MFGLPLIEIDTPGIGPIESETVPLTSNFKKLLFFKELDSPPLSAVALAKFAELKSLRPRFALEGSELAVRTARAKKSDPNLRLSKKVVI
jgi:hypothetical protein